MTDPQIALMMLGLFIFIIMLGFPIAFTLMAMGVGFGYYAYFQLDQAFFDNRGFGGCLDNTLIVDEFHNPAGGCSVNLILHRIALHPYR